MLVFLTVMFVLLLVIDVGFEESLAVRLLVYLAAIGTMWALLWGAALQKSERALVLQYGIQVPHMIRNKLSRISMFSMIFSPSI